MSQPSIDAMLGILNNANQTATIIDTQKTIANNLRASAERNNNNILSSMMNENQNLERRIGDYYLQAERNFHGLNNDLLKVENSLGRLADNHHNSSMIELLKVHASLDKSNDRIELNLTKQAAENYANLQIEASKNKMALKTKMLKLGNNIKETILRDNNDTRNLINSFNYDNL